MYKQIKGQDIIKEQTKKTIAHVFTNYLNSSENQYITKSIFDTLNDTYLN